MHSYGHMHVLHVLRLFDMLLSYVFLLFIEMWENYIDLCCWTLYNYFVSIVISELYFLQTRSFGGPRRISYTTLSVIYTVGIGGVNCWSWQVLLKIWVLTFVIHVCHIILLMFIEQWNCRRSCHTLRWAMIAFILPNWQSRSLQSIWKPT